MRLLLLFIVLSVTAAGVFAQGTNADSLERYDARPADVMLALESAGVFPSGSAFLFNAPGNTLIGGSQFITYAPQNATPNFVFGGTLTFTPGTDPDDGLETCALVARASIESGEETTEDATVEFAQINTFVDVGVTNAGDVYIVDRHDTGEDDLTVEVVEYEVPERAVMLAIVLDDMLTVYISGQRVIDSLEIQAAPGSFAFALETNNPNTSCTSSGLWAYTLPQDYVVDGCEITTDGTINQREGAGTTFDVVGQLSAGETVQAVAQTLDDEGFIWWQLDDNLWVREDVVNAAGYCRTLPQLPLSS